MGWSVTLTNGEVINEPVGRIEAWRNLRDYCRNKQLRIRHMTYNGEPMDYGDAYFVFFHLEAHMATGYQIHKKAVGTVRKHKDEHNINTTKAYIEWYLLPQDIKLPLQRTVKHKNKEPGAFEIIDDMSILVEK